MKSFFNLDLDVDNYEMIIINDFFRMFTIQFISQFAYSFFNNVEFLSSSFLENTSYILLSIIFYWLVFNRVISFNKKDSINYDSNLPHYLRIR